jgi:hypothetical protein
MMLSVDGVVGSNGIYVKPSVELDMMKKKPLTNNLKNYLIVGLMIK